MEIIWKLRDKKHKKGAIEREKDEMGRISSGWPSDFKIEMSTIFAFIPIFAEKVLSF